MSLGFTPHSAQFYTKTQPTFLRLLETHHFLLSEAGLRESKREEVLAGGGGHRGEDQGEAELQRHNHRGGGGPQRQQPALRPGLVHCNHS